MYACVHAVCSNIISCIKDILENSARALERSKTISKKENAIKYDGLFVGAQQTHSNKNELLKINSQLCTCVS